MNKKKVALLLIVTLIFGLFSGSRQIVSAASATKIYVSSEGNDEAAGSLNAPVQTIAKAVDLVPENGVALIYLLSNLEQPDSVTIPAGKRIRLLSGNADGTIKEENYYSVTLTGSSTEFDYFDVRGELAVAGIAFKMTEKDTESTNKSVFCVRENGVLTVMDGALIQNTDLYAITVYGEYSWDEEKYKYGTAYMTGGSITGNNGGIKVRGKLYISGGSITENFVQREWYNSLYDIDCSDVNEVTEVYLSGDPEIGTIGCRNNEYKILKFEDQLTTAENEKIGVYRVVGTDSDLGDQKLGEAVNDYSLTDTDAESFELMEGFGAYNGGLCISGNELLYTNTDNCQIELVRLCNNGKVDKYGYYRVYNDNDTFDVILDSSKDYTNDLLYIETSLGAKTYYNNGQGDIEIKNNTIPVTELFTATGGAVTLKCKSPDGSQEKEYTMNYSTEERLHLTIQDDIYYYINTSSPDRVGYIVYYNTDSSELASVNISIPDGCELYSDPWYRNEITGNTLDIPYYRSTYLKKEDGTKITYYFESVQNQSPEFSVIIDGTSYDPDDNNQIVASVPYDVDLSAYKLEFSATNNISIKVGDTVQFIGITEQDFTNGAVTYEVDPVTGSAITYEVTVNNQEQQTYQVTYRDENSVTKLNNILPTAYSDAKSFLEGEGLQLPQEAPYLNADGGFLGWYTSPVGGRRVNSLSSYDREDITVYAHWGVKNTGAITYKDHSGNDITSTLGNGYDAAKIYTYGTELSIPETEPYTRSGYRFTGWYDAATDGSKVTSISALNTGEITLFARWEQATGAITYKNHSDEDITALLGSDYSNAKAYTYGTELTVPQTAPYTRSGYRFAGWYDAATGGNKVTSISASNTGDITLYARWTRSTGNTGSYNTGSNSGYEVWTPKIPTEKETTEPTVAPENPSATPSVTPTDSKTDSKTDSATGSTTQTPTTVTELNVKTDETVIADKKGKDKCFYVNGKKIVSGLVYTPKGNLVAVDENGNMIRGSIIVIKNKETKQEDKYYAGKSGIIKKNDIITTSDGKRYFAGADGKLVTNDFVTTRKGNTCYCTETGEIAKSMVVKVDDKLYYAYASGRIAKSAMITQKDGTRYYVTENGELASATFVTYKGYRYYALESGKIIRSQTMIIGDTKYKFNKYGIIVSETKVF